MHKIELILHLFATTGIIKVKIINKSSIKFRNLLITIYIKRYE